MTPPTSGPDDVQRFVDPLYAVSVTDPTKALTYERSIDTTTASRGLRSWVLSGFGPDLATYDQTAYTLHGNVAPTLLVAIGTPKRVQPSQGKYPDLPAGIMRAIGATSVWSPPQIGTHAATYGLVIDCGDDPLHGRTVCSWMGTTPDSKAIPLFGVVVILSVVPFVKAETVTENVFGSLAP